MHTDGQVYEILYDADKVNALRTRLTNEINAMLVRLADEAIQSTSKESRFAGITVTAVPVITVTAKLLPVVARPKLKIKLRKS